MSDWKPVSTAPIDGSDIDVWAKDRRYTDCHYHLGDWLHWAYKGVDDEPRWDAIEGVTHWMPLPTPPALS